MECKMQSIGHAMSIVSRDLKLSRPVEDAILRAWLMSASRPIKSVIKHLITFSIDTRTRYNDGFSRLGNAYASAAARQLAHKPHRLDVMQFCSMFLSYVIERVPPTYLDGADSPSKVETKSDKTMQFVPSEGNAKSRKQFMHPDVFYEFQQKVLKVSGPQSVILDSEVDKNTCEERAPSQSPVPSVQHHTEVPDAMYKEQTLEYVQPREEDPPRKVAKVKLGRDDRVDERITLQRSLDRASKPSGLKTRVIPSQTENQVTSPSETLLSPLDSNIKEKVCSEKGVKRASKVHNCNTSVKSEPARMPGRTPSQDRLLAEILGTEIGREVRYDKDLGVISKETKDLIQEEESASGSKKRPAASNSSKSSISAQRRVRKKTKN